MTIPMIRLTTTGTIPLSQTTGLESHLVKTSGSPPAAEHGHNLHSNHECSYTHQLGLVDNQSYETHIQLLQTFEKSPGNMRRYIFGYIMTQMTASAAIAKHGEAAMNAFLQEFCQLKDKNIFKQVDTTTLSKDEQPNILCTINLIKWPY